MMFEPGTLVRSKEAILKTAGDDEQSRLCRIIGAVPEQRWRVVGVPEYKVELLAAPVTAFRRETDLVPVASN